MNWSSNRHVHMIRQFVYTAFENDVVEKDGTLETTTLDYLMKLWVSYNCMHVLKL